MKDYKRLTKRGVNGRAYYATPFASNSMQEIYEEDVKRMQEVMERLCDIEEKIENGTLVELPCKKGDDVFAIVNTTTYDNSIITGTVEGLAYIILDEYGDITFQHISRVSPIKPKQS